MKDYPHNTVVFGIINSSFMLAYLGLYFFFKKYGEKEKYKICIFLLFMIIACAEMILNGYSSYYKEERYNPENYFDTYNLWNKSTREALELIKADGKDFYRISCLQDYAMYGGMYFDYNGLAGFSSFENKNVKNILAKLGVYTSPRLVLCNGLTDFTKMIFSVGYDLESIDWGSQRLYPESYYPEISLKKNDYFLSLGFLVDDAIENFVFEGSDSFTNINNLSSCMTGVNEEIYNHVIGQLTYDEYGIVLAVDENNDYKLKLDSNCDYGVIVFKIPYDSRPAYVQFDYGVSAQDKAAPYIADGITGTINDYERISASYITDLTPLEDYYEVTIYMNERTYNDVYVPNIYLAYYNRDVLSNIYDILSQGQMQIVDYGNGYIKGKITVPEDGKILFTSIPYDTGWEIIVNGEKAEPIKLLENAFIGIRLPKGIFDIEFRYCVPGLKSGLIITIISTILFVLLVFKDIYIKKMRGNYEFK